MPTIPQLPAAAAVDSADLIPVSQAGVARSAALGDVLARTQPAILISTETLLGRTSIGPGGPEEVGIGAGLQLAGATLVATGGDHAAFSLAGVLDSGDTLIVDQDGTPGRVPVTQIRGLFAAGPNIIIDTSGTISATIPPRTPINSLPATVQAFGQDLLAINQGGTDCAISYSHLLNGQTIDMAPPAAAASDSDTFWVAQADSTMLRQSFAALWVWLNGRIPMVRTPVAEIATDTQLDGTVHLGRVVVCGQPLVLSANAANMGSGFHCEVVNVSSGDVVLGAGFLTVPGTRLLHSGQSAFIRGVSYSGGSVVYATIGAVPDVLPLPGVIQNFASGATTAATVQLTWQMPASAGAVAAYTVRFRTAGTAAWTTASTSVTGTHYTVAALAAGTAYEFSAVAVNASGSGGTSEIVSAGTQAALAVPGQVTGVSTGAITSSSIVLSWSVPGGGGAPASYDVQYRVAGSTVWSGILAGVTGTTANVTGLSSSTACQFTVTARNATGAGAASAVVSGSTSATAGSVSAVNWNVAPLGTFAHGVGVIPVNAHVTPAAAPIQFGFSNAANVLPSSWTPGVNVNSDLWGAYVPVPAAAGTWFGWAAGTDGSSPTVYPTSITVT
jgi:hypothetical protein